MSTNFDLFVMVGVLIAIQLVLINKTIEKRFTAMLQPRARPKKEKRFRLQRKYAPVHKMTYTHEEPITVRRKLQIRRLSCQNPYGSRFSRLRKHEHISRSPAPSLIRKWFF